MTGKAGRSFKDYKQELLEDAKVKQAYDALQKSYDIAKMIYSIRTEANLTQEQLAKRIGTRQANISRAEKGSSNITVGTLSKIAEATGYELVIIMKPIGKGTAHPALPDAPAESRVYGYHAGQATGYNSG